MHILTEQGTFILDSAVSDLVVAVISSIISLIIGGIITITINKKNNLLEARRNSALNEVLCIEAILDEIKESIVEIECDMELRGKIEKEHMDQLYVHLTKFIGLPMYVYNEKLAKKLLHSKKNVREFNAKMKNINTIEGISIDEKSKRIYKQVSDNLSIDIIKLSGYVGGMKWLLVGVKKNEILKLEKYIKDDKYIEDEK